ncbi:MAG: DUF350 domain-containing protein [Ketobacteraceae bacterium]|nr:DUF350 domain-containing protein [Ketobacteraceae bacterium]
MLDMLLTSIQGLHSFALYFVLALVDLALFKAAYAAITPHDEWGLIRKNNAAAATAFSGAIVGYAIALGGAASNSVNVMDFSVWAIVAFVAQLLAFLFARLMISDLAGRIKDGELAAGIMVAAVSVAIGIINAACMTY